MLDHGLLYALPSSTITAMFLTTMQTFQHHIPTRCLLSQAGNCDTPGRPLDIPLWPQIASTIQRHFDGALARPLMMDQNRLRLCASSTILHAMSAQPDPPSCPPRADSRLHCRDCTLVAGEAYRGRGGSIAKSAVGWQRLVMLLINTLSIASSSPVATLSFVAGTVMAR